MEMTGRKIAAHIRRMLGDSLIANRQTVLRAAADAMHAVRGRERLPGALAQQMLSDSVLRQLLQKDDALGVISQAIAAPALEAAYRATTAQNRKFHAEEIPAVTQLFTPRWVVEFLLQNSLGKLWLEMHPRSHLRKEWRWIVDAPTSRMRDPRSVTSIRVLDPACGTMNFGIVAIEMLREMYREEDSSRSIEAIDDTIVEHNLFGIDIDPVALEFAEETLQLKLSDLRRRKRQFNLTQVDALFESVPREYDVVSTNPPYLSSRNLPRESVSQLKKRYPNAWRDQYACFIERAIELLDVGGRAAMLTMQSFMFTASFEALRTSIDQRCAIESLAHFGPGLFEVGNPGTLQTAAFVLRREVDPSRRDLQTVSAFRLIDQSDKHASLARRSESHRTLQRNFRTSPRGAWCYWLTARQRELFTSLPKLAQTAPPRQGLATTDNARFVRFWWELDACDDAPCSPSCDTWFPYVKSGRSRRWHESPNHRVNWRDDGAEIKASIVSRYPYLDGQWQWVAKNAQYYFKPGITYSYLTSGDFSARRLDAGAIFDVAGSSLFPDDVPTVLAVLNSSVARQLLAAINPTVNFQVGDLRELPIPRGSSDALRADVLRAIELTRQIDQFDETSPDFVAPLPLHAAEEIFGELHRERQTLEKRIDQTVAELYGLPFERTGDACSRLDQADLTYRRQSFELSKIDGPVQLKSMAIDFDAWHVRLYKRRPRIWIFGDGKTKFFAVRHEQATRDVVRWIARQLGESIPANWDRFMDDGIAANLAPLAPILLNRQLKKESGRHVAEWSRTHQAIAHFKRATIASVNCCVFASPPRSRVSDLPSASTAS
ncbi:hypothetical protein BH10PSE14_BH10PSE14_38020 [soil metagenome]